jgi:hypothetical protein
MKITIDVWSICTVILVISVLAIGYSNITKDNKQNNTTQELNDTMQEFQDDLVLLNILYEIELMELKSEIIILQNQIQDYKDIIVYKDEQFKRKKGIIMNPTYEEVVTFLKEDKTDELKWTTEHDCTQFAHKTIRNAKQKGIYGCIVTIDMDVPKGNYEYSGHDIIAFHTVDAGIVYFEPQTDKQVYMYPGMNYATHLGHSDDYKMWVIQYDSCFERVN